jgi:protein-S-isoprenylcysteine O-methyltransferase Ste14
MLTSSGDPTVADALRKWRIKNIVFVVLLGALLLGGSGRPGWIAGWTYLVLVAAGPAATYKVLVKKSPDLLVERARLHEGTKPWDKAIAPLVALVLPLAMWVIAALDTRFGWSEIAAPLQVAGFVAIVFGVLLMLRAMAANRFFASTVRIQRDRGHTVVSDGPYAVIRHPGYVGLIGYVLGTPLALDSLYALPAGVVCAALVVLRTALEDRTLRAELEGYAAYAHRVRSRLVPLVW